MGGGEREGRFAFSNLSSISCSSDCCALIVNRCQPLSFVLHKLVSLNNMMRMTRPLLVEQ